jgi:flagellar hook assembly protein FlgD
MGDEKVTLVIYDLLGRKIRTLVQDFLPAGEQTVVWDGKDTFGVPAASGVYAVNLLQGEFAASKRIQLIK